MTNHDRDAAAKMLREVADRLAVAEDLAAASSESYRARLAASDLEARSSCMAYRVGALEQIIQQEVHALRSIVESYLTPETKPDKQRGKR